MSKCPVVVWHRNDLRLADNPSLVAALSTGAPVLSIYIHDEAALGDWPAGAARKWWLHQSLLSLEADYKAQGGKLFCFAGDTSKILLTISKVLGVREVFASRRFEPSVLEADRIIVSRLSQVQTSLHGFNSHLLMDPYALKNLSGKPFQVFTPFWKKFRTEFVLLREDRLAAFEKAKLSHLKGMERIPGQLRVEQLELLPKNNWHEKFSPHWEPGETGAQKRLAKFLEGIANEYQEGRDQPGVDGTSLLSPHLHFGEISPLRIWDSVDQLLKASRKESTRTSLETYLRELGWREFAHHLLFHFPHTPNRALRSEFDDFPWEKVKTKNWNAWTKGFTGFPIVDAGMRQLWQTGWMHNRVRMIVASFLVKDFRYPWQMGAKWFWDTLVDADLASNTMGWQWSGGCGADAAPYFRVFNPTLQGERFDPEGDYVRRWIPELKKVPSKWIHQPWSAPTSILSESGVELGKNYPRPVVDHAAERVLALKAFQVFRAKKK
jgi:deoxyribodipyrimidine photo-lyase